MVIGQIAVCAGIFAALAHTYRRTHEEVCALRFRHKHTLYSGLGHRRGILVIVGRAALQLAAVAPRPMAQPPLGQNILLVAVSPQGIISGNLTSQRDSCIGACPRHRGQSSTAGHSALGIFAAVECRIPHWLAEEFRTYCSRLYGLTPDDRVFYMTCTALNKELTRCTQLTYLPDIRVHDLRHSHVSLCIELGYSVVLVARRIGDTVPVVMRTYAHLYPNKQQELVSKLEAIGSPSSNDDESDLMSLG